MLGPTKAVQAGVIRDLLRHAGEDHMTVPDRIICRTQLERLHFELGWLPTQRVG